MQEVYTLLIVLFAVGIIIGMLLGQAMTQSHIKKSLSERGIDIFFGDE